MKADWARDHERCDMPQKEGRLPVATVQRIERLVGGDPLTEGQIMEFVGGRYGARSLVYLPPQVAAAILKRPADFIRAAKRYCEPEQPF